MALILNGDNGIVYANLNQDIRSLLMPKNWIINGMFDVWQRGTSQTSNGIGSADRWINGHTTSTKTVTRDAFAAGQTDVPNNPKYYLRTVAVSSNTADAYVGVQQRIEDISKLAGKTVALSFWAKSNANKNVTLKFTQRFGTGGSAEVDGIGIQKFALTTAWQRFTKVVTLPSVVGKTIAADSYLQLVIIFDAGSNLNPTTDSLGNQSGTFDIANVSLVEGSVAVECQNQPYADVLRECQRYYWRSSGDSVYSFHSLGVAVSATQIRCILIPTVAMRIASSAVTYANLAGTDGLSSNPITSIAIDRSTPLRTAVFCITSSLIQYRPYELLNNNNASGFIALEAEL